MKSFQNIIRIMLTFVVFVLCTFTAAAQTQRVTGTVTDTQGELLPGVSVGIKGTTLGTVTDINGKFTIAIPDGASKTLEFTFIGYTSQTVEIGNRTVLNVTMQESSQDLEEVLVIGYGSTRKSDLTGSVVSVQLKETDVAQAGSFDVLLQGRAAGVQVTSGNSAPGGAVEIKIRGTSSFNSTSEPLYVVDGVILNSVSQDVRSAMRGSANMQEAQNPLSSINAKDVLSMEILKDASATAIYGSQGANGVVLITTRQGTTEKPKIEYNTTLGFARRAKTIPVLDLEGYAAWRNEVGTGRIDPDTLIAVNWQDELMRTAISQSHRIRVSGVKDQTNYLIAGGFFNNNGIVKQTNVKQADFRINLDQKLGKNIKIGTKSTFTYTTNNMTQGTDPNGDYNSSMIRSMLNSRPYKTHAPVTEDPELTDEYAAYEYPDMWLTQYEDRSEEYRVTPSLFAEIKFTSWLSFRSTAGLDFRNKSRGRSYGKGIKRGKDAIGQAGLATMQSMRWNIDNILTVSKTFDKKHRVTLNAGTTASATRVENSSIENEDFPNFAYPTFGFDGMILGRKPLSEVFSEPLTTLVSFLARGIYSYDDRYVLTATIRSDGSSKFAKENRFSYFPSFALAWRIKQESFMKDVNMIDNLKLRVGWGRVGNQALSPYQTMVTYGTSDAVNYALFNTGVQIGYRALGVANPALRWETSDQTNIGLDFGLFKDRITGTVEVYDKRTRDLLQRITLAPSGGYDNMWVNRGIIQNRGLEIALDIQPVRSKDVNWSLGGNISFNRNKILDSARPLGLFGHNKWRAFLGDVVTNSTYMKTEANIFIEGKPVALFYGMKTRGIIQTWDENVPTFDGKPSEPGMVYFQDLNGDGNITRADYTIIGNPNPKFTYGFYTSFSWKNLSLDAMFNGVYGNDVLNGNLIIENKTSFQRNIRRDAYYKAWREDAPSETHPGLGKSPSDIEISDRYIEDGSFLRLSSLTLAYRFDVSYLKWVKALNLSVTGRNLFLLTKYSGWDPEVNSFSFNPLKVGIDWGSYPNYRAITFGLGITF